MRTQRHYTGLLIVIVVVFLIIGLMTTGAAHRALAQLNPTAQQATIDAYLATQFAATAQAQMTPNMTATLAAHFNAALTGTASFQSTLDAQFNAALTASAQPTPTPPSDAALPDWLPDDPGLIAALDFVDLFADNRHGWPLAPSDGFLSVVETGDPLQPTPALAADDFALVFNFESMGDDFDAGIRFGANGATGYTVLITTSLDDTPRYLLYAEDGVLVDGLDIEFLTSMSGESLPVFDATGRNRVGVVKQGDTLTLYINNQVASFLILPQAEAFGTLALVGEGVRFDDVVMTTDLVFADALMHGPLTPGRTERTQGTAASQPTLAPVTQDQPAPLPNPINTLLSELEDNALLPSGERFLVGQWADLSSATAFQTLNSGFVEGVPLDSFVLHANVSFNIWATTCGFFFRWDDTTQSGYTIVLETDGKNILNYIEAGWPASPDPVTIDFAWESIDGRPFSSLTLVGHGGNYTLYVNGFVARTFFDERQREGVLGIYIDSMDWSQPPCTITDVWLVGMDAGSAFGTGPRLPGSGLVTFAPAVCPAHRLCASRYAQVYTTDRDGLRVRSTMNTSAPILESLPSGTQVYLLSGPITVNGYTWWYIHTPNGTVGYSVEAADGVQTLVPVP